MRDSYLLDLALLLLLAVVVEDLCQRSEDLRSLCRVEHHEAVRSVSKTRSTYLETVHLDIRHGVLRVRGTSRRESYVQQVYMEREEGGCGRWAHFPAMMYATHAIMGKGRRM